MVDFPVNVKNGVNKRIADEAIKQFEAKEFNISCKELTLKRAILVHDSHFTVYESEYRGSAVAVKVVAVEETQQIADYIDALVDLTSLAALPHDNISSFYGAGYTLNSENKLREIMIVTEPFERGTLRSLLKKSLSWSTKISLARDIARAVSYLHDQSVIHGDIRTSTILVNEQYQAKLVDFAHLCGERSRLETRTYNTTKGTVALSPEMARNQMYDFGADVYAFGMLLFELITETPPNKNFRYRNAHGGFALLETELRAAVKPGCPAGLEALAYSCCETKAARRLIAPQVVDELDFLMIELTRKPDDPRITSPLRRSSSSTNKYAHLLLPSPGSSKNLLSPKSSAADLKSPSGADKPAPAPVMLSSVTPVKAELEKVNEHDEEHETESQHSVHSIAEAMEAASGVAEAPALEPAVLSVAPDAGAKPSVVVEETNNTAESEIEIKTQKPTVPVGGKNKRRKGLIDPTTAHNEDAAEPPHSNKPTPPTESAPPVVPSQTQPVEILTADEALSLIASIKHIVHDALEPGADAGEVPLTADEVSHINLEPLVDEGTNTSPRAEVAAKFIFVSQTPFVGSDDALVVSNGVSTSTSEPAVSHESASASKKKNRARAKIDYAVETPLQADVSSSAPQQQEEAPPTTLGNEKVGVSVSEGTQEKIPLSVAKAGSSVQTPAVPTDSGRKQAVCVDFAPAPARRVSIVSAPSDAPPALNTPPPVPAVPAPAVAAPAVPTVPPPPPPMAPASHASVSHDRPAAVERRRSVLLPPGDYINITNLMSDSPVPLRKEDVYQDLSVDGASGGGGDVESAHRRSSMPDLVPLSDEQDVLDSSPIDAADTQVVEAATEKAEKETTEPESAKSVARVPVESVPLSATVPESEPEPEQEKPIPAPTAAPPLTHTPTPAVPLLSQFALTSTAAAAVTVDAPASSAKAARPGRSVERVDTQPVPIPATIRATETAMAAVLPSPSVPVVATTVAVGSASEPRSVPEPTSKPEDVATEPVEEVTASATKRTRGARGGKGRNKNKGINSASASPVPTEAEISFSAVEEPKSFTEPVAAPTMSTPQAVKVRPAGGFEEVFSPTTPVPVISEPTTQRSTADALAATPTSPPSKIETSLFQSPAGEKSGLNSNQKRRMRREQARAAAAAFISAADAAEEVIVERGPAHKPSESLPATQAGCVVTSDASEEAQEVYTPPYSPPPVPPVVPTTPAVVPAPALAATADASRNVLSSPPRNQNTTAASAAGPAATTHLETPVVKAPASPLRSPCGSLPVPAPHRHVHHFDLPAPQVTPPMHFPVSSQALAHLPDPPASPSSPIPHKQEPSENSEIVQTVFSDKDVNISSGKKVAQQAAYSTPHRTVEKTNRFNLLAQADDSHTKTLRSKILSPAAASQKAVLTAPPVQVVSVSAPVVSAYEERMIAMERRLQQLAEENLALQRDLQAAVSKPSSAVSVASLPVAPAAREHVPAVPAVPVIETAPAAEDVLTSSDVTLSESSAATLGSEPRHPHQLADSSAGSAAGAVGPQSTARSSLGAVLRDFERVDLSVERSMEKEQQGEDDTDEGEESDSDGADESESESVSDDSEEPVTSESAAEVEETPMPVTHSVDVTVPVSNTEVAGTPLTPPAAPVVPAVPSTPSAPAGYVDVLKYLEAMQTDLRSQLSSLQAPPTPAPAPLPVGDISAPPSTPAALPQGSTEAELQLQSQIASVIDSKLGAVQAQISQFSTLLNAILLAQSPMPGARPAHDDASQGTSNSTHSSAFVTPNSILGSISQPLDGEDESTSPTSPQLGPQKLFSQSDQPVFGTYNQDMPGLIPSSDFQPFTARRPSETTETETRSETKSEIMGEVVHVPSADALCASTTDNQAEPSSDHGRKSTVELKFESCEETFVPSSGEGEMSQDQPSNGEESDQEDGTEDLESPARHVTETVLEVDVPSYVPFSGGGRKAVEDSDSDSVTEPAPVSIVLPLQPVSDASTAPNRKSLSPTTVEVSADHSTTTGLVGPSTAEEEPLEAWEIKAIKKTAERPTQPPTPPSVATALFVPTSSPSDSAPVSPVPAGAPAKPPKPPKQPSTPVVSVATEPEPVQKAEPVAEVGPSSGSATVSQSQMTAPTGSAVEQADHEHELEALSDTTHIAQHGTTDVTEKPTTTSRAPTPESRAASPFLRNRVPFPLSAHDGAHSQFPALFGEPELAEVVSEAVKDAAMSIAEAAKVAEQASVSVEVMSPSDVFEAAEEEIRALDSRLHGPATPRAAPATTLTEPVVVHESHAQVTHTDSSVPPAPVDSAVSTPSTRSSQSSHSSRESSVIDATGIEYPYNEDNYWPPSCSLPAAVQALHQHHENQQRAFLAEQEQDLQDELSEARSAYPFGSYQYSAPPALNSSLGSVNSAHSHHSAHSARHHQHAQLSSPKQDSPPAKVLSTSMKFLEELSRLNNHYDAKEEPAQAFVPNRKPLDYSKSPQSTQVDLRQPQVGQPNLHQAPHAPQGQTSHVPHVSHGQSHPHLYAHPHPHSAEKHLHVSPQSSLSRIGDGHPQQPTHPVSTAHTVHRHSPLLRSNTPPALQRPLAHSDPYLEHHSPQHSPRQQDPMKAPTDPFQSPQPRTYGTPHTQSTLSNSGDRSRRPESSHNTPYNQSHHGAHHQQGSAHNQYHHQQSHTPHTPYEQHDHYGSPPLPDEEEPIDEVHTQRLADLTGVLNNFLSVIEKCNDISDSADQAVSQLDRNMSRMDQRSHRRVLNAGTRTASFAPNLSFYEPPPLPPASPLARYNSSGSIRLDDEYDARYVDYEGSDDERSAARSRTGSLSVSRSRTNSAANFDSTSNIAREPVHTKHFLSPSTKPALLRFDKSASQQSLHPASSFRNATTPSNNSYFKAPLGIQVNNTSSGVSVSGRSAVSKTPVVTHQQEALPSRKAAVPVQNSRGGRSTSRTRTDRAASFASTIGTVVSGLSSVGESDRAQYQQQHQQQQHQQHLNRASSFSAELRRSSDSDQVIVDGRVQPMRRSGSQQGLTSILRQNSTESAGTPQEETRGRSFSQVSMVSKLSNGAQSRSNSPRSRSPRRSPSPHRVPSPKEIQSKFNNVTAYTFRSDTSARRIC